MTLQKHKPRIILFDFQDKGDEEAIDMENWILAFNLCQANALKE